MIHIVGLGVKQGDLTLNALEKLCGGMPVLLRTAVTPAAEYLKQKGIAFASLDRVYEETEDYDEVNEAIVEAVLDAARAGDVVFGVIDGAGLMAASVKAVCAAATAEGVAVSVTPGVGLYEYAAGEAGGLDNACVIAAIDLENAIVDVRRPLIVCELNDRVTASDCKLKLLDRYPADWEVYLNGETIALEDMDRAEAYDHLTALVLPAMRLEQVERYDFYHLMEVVERLRRPDGCPWDREQTHQSMKADLVDEVYEVLDAIDEGDPYKLADELGDLMLHVAMHAAIGAEYAEFTIDDVTWAICNKMITRHPHVFGEISVKDSDEVLVNWEKIKQGEKQLKTQTEVMRDVPASFPALMRAAKVQKKAKNVGFDWDDAKEALKKVREEANEVEEVWDDPEKLFGELGDLLFAVVNVCRMKKCPPELALHGTTEKFIRRFAYVEQRAGEMGRKLNNMTLAEMDALWDECKALERQKA